MKKTLMIFVIFVFSCNLWAGTYSGGDGTVSGPYQIATLSDLEELSTTSADWTAHFIQTADIDASATDDGGSGFLTIGNQFTFFTGSYNGLGCTIDGLTIKRSSTNYVGLFGGTDGATIKNLGLINIDITGGNLGVGALVGTCGASSISNCYSSGTVTGGESVGGLAGWNESSTTDNCYSTVTVIGTSEVGGLVGYNQSSSVITNCYSMGSVTRLSGTEVSFGGFCGHNDGSTINNSYSIGSVTYDGDPDPTDKGFVGIETPTNTYNNNFFNSEVSNQSTATGAVAKSIAEMQTESTFTNAGWDFEGESTNGTDDDWDISGSYPFLYFPEGTVDNPLFITSLADLQSLSATSADWGKYIVQSVDIDASATNSGEGFLPIGTESWHFTGTYDGLNHTIDALFINRSTNYIGLFCRTNAATIQNLGLTNVNITGSTVDITGSTYVGALAGWNGISDISNCYSSGSVSGAYYVGGLVGQNRLSSNITNCSSSSTVSGTNYIGGLVASNSSICLISNCYNTGSVTGTIKVGGLVGSDISSTVSNCYSSGTVNGSSQVGGLIGDIRSSTVSNNYSRGSVSGSSDVGGLIGSISTTSWPDTIRNSFWDIQTSGQSSSAAGMGKSTDDMKSSVTYLSFGWDFQDETDNGSDDYWSISDDNSGYPALTWQGFDNTNLTFPAMPYLTTSAVSSITKTTATCGGNIISENRASILGKGVCWNTSGSPDINDDKTTDGTGIGTFTSSITGLTLATTYYVRAYATNSAGSNYGSEVSFTTMFFNGSGTSEDPFLINSLSDLSYLAQHDNHWEEGYYFKQTVNIDATQTQYWDDSDDNFDGDLYNDENDGTSTGNNEGFLSIGLSDYFEGYYDGQGYTIDGLTINRSGTDYVGFFGYAYATIENLGLSNIDFTGNDWVGGIVPVGDGGTLIHECYTNGSLSGNSYVGGVCGQLMGPDWGDNRVTNSYSRTSILGAYYVGGLVGHVGGTVTNCYAAGSVTGTDSDFGGLIGRVGGKGTVSNSFWDTESSGQGISGGGTGKTTADMKDIATYTNTVTEGLTTAWDFPGTMNDDAGSNDYWDMDIPNGLLNDGYPFLDWENGVEIATSIELVSFTANYSRGTVTLNWETASETDNAHFLIYRNDEVIGTVEGAGTTTEPHEYEFTDAQIISGNTYLYMLADVSYANEEIKHSDNAITITIPENDIPTEFALNANYPNPFNPRTVINYEISAISDVDLSIYDMNGRKVATLVDGSKPAGYYKVDWDASQYSSGIYFYRLQTDGFVDTKKMVLMK